MEDSRAATQRVIFWALSVSYGCEQLRGSCQRLSRVATATLSRAATAANVFIIVPPRVPTTLRSLLLVRFVATGETLITIFKSH